MRNNEFNEFAHTALAACRVIAERCVAAAYHLNEAANKVDLEDPSTYGELYAELGAAMIRTQSIADLAHENGHEFEDALTHAGLLPPPSVEVN